MAQYAEDDRPRLKRHLVEDAIKLAMQNRWQEALALNQKIIEMFPDDVDAHNRMGRALTELGRYEESRAAYQRSISIDPHNSIAQKNLRRLAQLSSSEAPPPASEKLDLRLLATETGKTGILNLVQIPDRAVLARMGVADRVRLEVNGRALMVYNSRNELIGQLEPRASQRLIELIKGGNGYTAAILDPEDTHPQVIVKEVYQHPSQAGKVSFPPSSAGAAATRSYIRDSLFRYGLEEEEEEEEGEYGPEGGPEAEEPVEEDFGTEENGSI